MADPYSGVSITGYNSNPPADDGSQTEANRVKWATIKTKLNDPVKTRTDDMNTALIAAFGKLLGGGGITSTSISYTVLGTDQGKLVRATNSGVTITTPDATNVDDPFVFGLLNDSSGDITFDGSGSQTIDGDAAVTVPSGAGLLVFTDGSNWFTTGQNFQRTLVAPQGYLTLLSLASSALSPVPSSDQSAKTSVFYRPDRGNLVPIPDGTNFAVREFSELTLTLSNPNHVGSAIYDIYVFSNPSNGAVTIATGPAWTTATAGSGARGTGAGSAELDLLKGLPVNKTQITARNGSTTYTIAAKCGIVVGTMFMDATAGQVSCHCEFGQSRKWGLVNFYNRRDITVRAGDATSSWNYGTNTIRAANNASANSITTLCGLSDEMILVREKQLIRPANMNLGSGVTGSGDAEIGIGVNSTTVMTGTRGIFQFSFVSNVAGQPAPIVADSVEAEAVVQPAIGIQTITALEITPAASNTTVSYFGGETNMLLVAKWRG